MLIQHGQSLRSHLSGGHLRYVARVMGYDCMVLVKDYTINSVEVFLELVVHLEGLWELMLEFGEARLSDSYQLHISWVMFLSLASRTLFYCSIQRLVWLLKSFFFHLLVKN